MLNLAERGEYFLYPMDVFVAFPDIFGEKTKWKTPNNSARASHFFVYFFYIHCTTTTWNVLMPGLMVWWTGGRQRTTTIFFSLFLYKFGWVLKYPTAQKIRPDTLSEAK